MTKNQNYYKSQQYAKLQKNKERIHKLCFALDDSGIYLFFRRENGINYGYVGKAEKLLTRMAQHLSGYDQHIDLSIKKHKLYDENTNQTGWACCVLEYCDIFELSAREDYWIAEYAKRGYQMKNKIGVGIDSERKESKGYRQGLAQGRLNAAKELKPLFNNYLSVIYQDVDVQNGDKPPGKNQEKAMNKFNAFIYWDMGE